MLAFKICTRHPKLVFLFLFMLLPELLSAQDLPLSKAFAHNDYWHKRPLYDALDNGYTHIEADVYLRRGQLLVSHLPPFFSKKRTLEALYLKPLMAYAQTADSQPITLMIDVKSKAQPTYEALEQLLQNYQGLISTYTAGVITKRKVTIVLTGHKPFQFLKNQTSGWAFIDDDLIKPSANARFNALFQTASCKYSNVLSWTGEGVMPAQERRQLCAFVEQAHSEGKKVRLWASPENRTVWAELLSCGIDLINTDQLLRLKTFLLEEVLRFAKAEPHADFTQ